MSVDKEKREQMIRSLMEAARESSTWTVLYHQAVADQVGLNITDHKALDILSRRGAMTAGQLAEITGLTSGAITGVIDRLEKAGYAHRERDPNDRRRVIIQPDTGNAAQSLGPLFAHFQARFGPLLEDYGEENLRLLLQYTQESARFLQEEIAWLKNLPPDTRTTPEEK
jgi:DNA-binding MarR family transcriptional regulator